MSGCKGKCQTIKDNMPLVYEAGKRDGCLPLWNVITNNGEQADYNNFFSPYSGRNWSDETFNPVKLVPLTAERMFFGARDITQMVCELDGSNCSNWNYAFSMSGFYELPIIDMRNAFEEQHCVFSDMPNLRKIECVYLPSVPINECFTYLPNLEEISFTGSFVNSQNFSASTKLTKQSVINIMNARSSDSIADGSTMYFDVNMIPTLFTDSDEWMELVMEHPNWNVEFVSNE